MSALTTRPLEALDLPLVAELHKRAFPGDPWEAPALARLLAMPGAFGLLLLRDGTPSGFLLARLALDEAEILTLGVLPEDRGLGGGAALLSAGLSRMAECGAARVFLEVAEDNTAARALYRASGFQEAGRRRGYYSGPEGVRDGLLLARAIPEAGLSPQ